MSRPTTELAHLFRQLKAPAAARALPKLADRAREEEWSFEQFAAALLKTETDSRDSHGGQARIKAARFPARKTLEEFDFAFQHSIPKNQVLHLGQLDSAPFVLPPRRRAAIRNQTSRPIPDHRGPSHAEVDAARHPVRLLSPTPGGSPGDFGARIQQDPLTSPADNLRPGAAP